MKRSDLAAVICSAQTAMQRVLDSWENGDLAEAVRELAAVKRDEIDPAVTWWESDE